MKVSQQSPLSAPQTSSLLLRRLIRDISERCLAESRHRALSTCRASWQIIFGLSDRSHYQPAYKPLNFFDTTCVWINNTSGIMSSLWMQTTIHSLFANIFKWTFKVLSLRHPTGKLMDNGLYIKKNTAPTFGCCILWSKGRSLIIYWYVNLHRDINNSIYFCLYNIVHVNIFRRRIQGYD